MAFVRIYVKKRLQLGRLNFAQSQMHKIGTVGVAAVKNRLAAARGPEDAPAKPLTRGYAIQKTRMLSRGGFRRTGAGTGQKGVRNLMLTGDMLRNFQVRTVSEKSARAGVTGRSTVKTMRSKRGRLVGVPNKVKAWANQQIEPWMVFSPKNQKAVMEAARRVFQENIKRLVLKGVLGGRQR